MTDRERLIELICESIQTDECIGHCNHPYCGKCEHLADHLLANGVIVPPCKPIGVMSDGNEFNTDVYCPYCGTNLSGLYGEEPTRIIQCYACGEFLDNRKIITKEEAEKALAERIGK